MMSPPSRCFCWQFGSPLRRRRDERLTGPQTHRLTGPQTHRLTDLGAKLAHRLTDLGAKLALLTDLGAKLVFWLPGHKLTGLQAHRPGS